MIHDIAIIGMGCQFPGAADLAAFDRVIRRGEPQFRPVSRRRWHHKIFFAPGDFRARNRAYTDRFARLDKIYQFAAMHYGIPPSRARLMDPQHRLLLEVTRAALQDAGLERRSFDRPRTGVFIGASGSEYSIMLGAACRIEQMLGGAYGPRPGDEATASAVMTAVQNVPPLRSFTLPGTLVNMAAATISDCFDLGGPSFTTDAACAASLVALNEAVMHLRTGACSAAVVGGVYISVIPDTMLCFSKVGALSFSGYCRPFDKRADGFVLGEGAGAVVLRPLDEAVAAGDRIYAVIRGIGVTNDGTAEGPMTPKMTGQLAALRQAYRDADLDPLSIGLVEAHGTATTVGDKVESGALAALREGAAASGRICYLSSVKSLIGHSLSAAGVAGLIKASLCVYHGVIPPQPDIQPNPKLPLEAAGLRLTPELREWPDDGATPRRAGVNSFGFGGTNVHVVLEQAPAVPSVTTSQGTAEGSPTRSELFLLSAGSPSLLERYLGDILTLLERDPAPSLSDLAYTLAARQLLGCRVAVVAAARAELVSRLQAARAALAEGRTGSPVSAGVFLRAEPLRKGECKVAFLFPGQGSQQPGMLADLIERFPQVRASLEELDAITRKTSGVSVWEAAHGPEADTPEGRARLTGTDVCQPALGAHWMALTRLLADLSVRPDLALGHSVGEFPAAASLGLLDPAVAIAFMAERGRAMAGAALEDPGTMLAVRCDRPAAEALVEGVPGAWVANHNQPKQVVISGTASGVGEVERRATAARIAAKRLEVSHAFHSPLFDGIQSQMAALAGRCPLSGPTERLISCISGKGGHGADELVETWARHQVAPVEFVAAVQSLDAAGARVYVQVGGGSTLLSMARASLAERAEGRWFVPLTGTGPDEARSFLAGLAQLAVLGVPVDPLGLFAGAPRPRLVDLPITPLATQRYFAMSKERKRGAPAASAAAGSRAADVPAVDAAAEPAVAAPPETASAPALAAPDGSTGGESSGIEQLIALFREQTAFLAAASGGLVVDHPPPAAHPPPPAEPFAADAPPGEGGS
jgi:acyl transferase domain-containing protein